MCESTNLERKIALFSRAAVMKGLSPDAQKEIANAAVIKRYTKNQVVFRSDTPYDNFALVEYGLIRVSRYSALGKRLTYLLAGPGEPINLVSPFTKASRANMAEAARDTTIVSVQNKIFIEFAFAHPQLIINIIDTLGQAVDSSNSRILDMLEKKVIERLKRTLHTLSKKFGPVLNFTAVEIAELAGTTTETALRVLGNLRQVGTIEKRRGQIHIINPEALIDPETDELWI
ncbi:putative transcriptional regulator, Crp/Fnr family [Desulfosarcina variabilis str. Montpellier]|uniref:Crp/Fnr family transcriptional regulator n=1 Tax=Desulfosarcina variabilis TaxID=2300 RepID=UPI003AFAE68D